jgi:IclR family transcriptional regulator, acetate operon repressor
VGSAFEHTKASSATLIHSVQNAFHLIETLAGLGGLANVKQLSHASGLSLTKTYNLVRTLMHEGYLGRNADGEFFLSGAWDSLGHKQPLSVMMSRARPLLRQLRDGAGAQVYLAGYVDGEMEILEYVAAPREDALNLWVDFRDSAHATAIGKAILASMALEERDDFLSRHPLESLTPHTITERKRLEEELASRPHLTVDLQEYSPGIHCLALPIRTPDFVGSLGLLRHVDRSGSAFDEYSTRKLADTVDKLALILELGTSA